LADRPRISLGKRQLLIFSYPETNIRLNKGLILKGTSNYKNEKIFFKLNTTFPFLSFQAATIRSLDDIAFDAHMSGRLPTGGTTLIVHVIAGNLIYTANVGDCKSILSSRGAPEALSEAHNPPVESEKKRFSSAGVSIFSDHIEGSDINVCRTIGDYDLGPPLKWRDTSSGALCGPLISEPEISVRMIEPTDEFLIVATDGLWDYYTPESSVITQSRQRLRANNNDPQLTANWLVMEALHRQRGTLHAGTPGDNVTVMLIRLRLLPAIPRTSTSRLNLRRAPSDADSQKTS